MKQYFTFKIGIIFLAIVVFACCKKKKVADNPNTVPIINCTLSMSSIVTNDTVYTVIDDTAYATGNNTYYTEHKITGTHGCSVEFEGITFPNAGTYAITSVFNEVVPGSNKVYIQYYSNGVSYNGQSGNVKITGSGTGAIMEFCKVNFKESFGDEKIVSLKSDSE